MNLVQNVYLDDFKVRLETGLVGGKKTRSLDQIKGKPCYNTLEVTFLKP